MLIFKPHNYTTRIKQFGMKIGSSSQGMCLCYNQTMTYINKETTGKERNQLIRNILLAIRELNQSNEVNTNTKDLIAYIALNLKEIYRGIDMTVQAWEGRPSPASTIRGTSSRSRSVRMA